MARWVVILGVRLRLSKIRTGIIVRCTRNVFQGEAMVSEAFEPPSLDIVFSTVAVQGFMMRRSALGRAAFFSYAFGPHRRRVHGLCYRVQDRKTTVDDAERRLKGAPHGHFPHAPRDVAKVPSRKGHDTNGADDTYPEALVSTRTRDCFASHTRIQLRILP